MLRSLDRLPATPHLFMAMSVAILLLLAISVAPPAAGEIVEEGFTVTDTIVGSVVMDDPARD